ncbi:hypothetical protein Tco_0998374 [Tanacetum coccineum]
MILELSDRTISTTHRHRRWSFRESYNVLFSAAFVVVDYVADPGPLILGSGNPTSTSDLMIDSRSLSFTPFGGSDFLMEEIDEFLEHDDSIPPGVDGIYDSEEILFCCPICTKSVMTAHWKLIDQEIEATMMPEDYILQYNGKLQPPFGNSSVGESGHGTFLMLVSPLRTSSSMQVVHTAAGG